MKLTPSSELLSIIEEARSEDQMMLKLNIFLNQLVERETPIFSFRLAEVPWNSTTTGFLKDNFAIFYISSIHTEKALSSLKEAGYEVSESHSEDAPYLSKRWNVKIV